MKILVAGEGNLQPLAGLGREAPVLQSSCKVPAKGCQQLHCVGQYRHVTGPEQTRTVVALSSDIWNTRTCTQRFPQAMGGAC